MAHQPTSVILRSYQVGFGDCFLLSFCYGEEEGAEVRHVLLDFGTTGLPREGLSMVQIAKQIESACGGQLHAVIATHRHADHISGFAGESGRIIKGLEPKLVLQPWTEQPDVPEDAPEVPAHLRDAQRLRGMLAEMHQVAESALYEINRLGNPLKTTTRQLQFLGETNLTNQAALEMLQSLRCPHVYASYGEPSGLEEILPGVKVRVLGPPTLEQSRAIRKDRQEDPSEFWHLQAMASERSAATAKPLFPDAAQVPPDQYPDNTRWFIPRLEALRGDQILEIVRILDETMNNTSLILLFEVGGKKLLFAGDAQIESWEYVLKTAGDREEVCALLAEVDVYKVGHHGSLNATPKTLWNLFKKKGDQNRPDRLRTLLSTKAGKHGHKDRGTEVPCKKLEAALQENSTLYSTQSLKSKKKPCHEVRIEV
ncbi:MAG TPA: hypothetical protein VLQ45_08990 [Thermoanaerobaculia bacterium]|nr:hypothetical protein [Thermoanaerobaculia bacterium]